MKGLARSTVLWFIAYVATMGVGIWLLWLARANAIAQLDNPQERAQWQEWEAARIEARLRDNPTLAREQLPTSEEPPTLVLMRDRFSAVVATCLATGTALFAFLAFVVQGIISRRASPPAAPPADEPDADALLFARRAGE